jgi:hypothetical protein
VVVHARNVGSSKSYETFQSISYALAPPASAVTLTPSVASPATVGASVTFTAAASGGSGNYQYKFLLRLPGGTLTTVRDYATAASWSWGTTGLSAGTLTGWSSTHTQRRLGEELRDVQVDQLWADGAIADVILGTARRHGTARSAESDYVPSLSGDHSLATDSRGQGGQTFGLPSSMSTAAGAVVHPEPDGDGA